MKKTKIYEDDSVVIYSKQGKDITDLDEIARSVVVGGLIGYKTFCLLAKKPKLLWSKCRKDIESLIETMEEIIERG